MKIKYKVEYDTATNELYIDGKAKGKCSKKTAAQMVGDYLITKIRSAECDDIFARILRK